MKGQGKLDEAIAAYLRAIASDPDYARAHNNLGVVLERQGKADQAIAEYRRAIAINPDYALAHHNLALALNRHTGFPGRSDRSRGVFEDPTSGAPAQPAAV